MSYAFFEHGLRCRHCGQTSRASITTRIESPPGSVHRVGSKLEVTDLDMMSSHYQVQPWNARAPLHVLEKWICAGCNDVNWVEVIVKDGIVVSIDVVAVDGGTLDRAHFASDGMAESYEDLVGEPFYDGDVPRNDWASRLRECLARRRTL